MIAAWLRSFTIRTRMAGAIAMVLAMFAIVGTTGLAGGLEMKVLNHHIADHSIAENRAVTEIRMQLAQVQLHEKQMVIDYEDGVAVLKAREAWTRSIDKAKEAFRSLLEGEEDDDNPLARTAIEELEAYAKASTPVLEQVQNGAYDNARVITRMLARAVSHFAKAEEAAGKIDAIVVAEANETLAEFEAMSMLVLAAFAGALGLVVLIVVPLTLLNSRSITQPIDEARRLAQAIAAGDLTQPVNPQGRDETAQLLQALQQMQDWLRSVVGDVRDASASIEVASREVAAGNADLSARTEQTAGSLQQTASSMSQLTGTVGQSADAARQASQLAGSAAEVAQRGGTAVAQVVSTMDEISGASKKIADIIGTIDGIAFQTNILALNAAVEAARAGEQGRGFAVVAAEVRSLAQRSAEAARQIKTLIGASVDKVDSGSRLVADAGSTMAEIVASVQRVADIIGEVTAASVEQREGIGQVNGAVAQLDQMTQQNAALVEESAAAAESLKAQAARLASLVATFKVGADRAVAAPAPLAAAVIAQARSAARAEPSAAAPAAAAPAPRPAAASTPSDADWETF